MLKKILLTIIVTVNQLLLSKLTCSSKLLRFQYYQDV